MKKEVKQAVRKDFIEMLAYYLDANLSNEEARKEALIKLNWMLKEQYYYDGHNRPNYQDFFTQYLCDSGLGATYYDDMRSALIGFGYDDKKYYPDDKVFKLYGYVYYVAFIDLCKQYNIGYPDWMTREDVMRFYPNKRAEYEKQLRDFRY